MRFSCVLNFAMFSRVVIAGMLSGLDRVLLGGQAKCVPAHRMKDVEAAHAFVARDDVGRGVAFGMSDVQARRRSDTGTYRDVEFRLSPDRNFVRPDLARGKARARPRSPAISVRSDQRDKVCGVVHVGGNQRMNRKAGMGKKHSCSFAFIRVNPVNASSDPRHSKRAQDTRVREILGDDFERARPERACRNPVVEETGQTFDENAILKALQSRSCSRISSWRTIPVWKSMPWGARPGIYSARYAGADATITENIAKLLAELRPSGDATVRGRAFRCVLALAREGQVARRLSKG